MVPTTNLFKVHRLVLQRIFCSNICKEVHTLDRCLGEAQELMMMLGLLDESVDNVWNLAIPESLGRPARSADASGRMDHECQPFMALRSIFEASSWCCIRSGVRERQRPEYCP